MGELHTRAPTIAAAVQQVAVALARLPPARQARIARVLIAPVALGELRIDWGRAG